MPAEVSEVKRVAKHCVYYEFTGCLYNACDLTGKLVVPSSMRHAVLYEAHGSVNGCVITGATCMSSDSLMRDQHPQLDQRQRREHRSINSRRASDDLVNTEYQFPSFMAVSFTHINAKKQQGLIAIHSLGQLRKSFDWTQN